MTDREMEKAIEKGIMTNELAIKLLSEVELVCLYEEQTYEALEMAIKALEQQSIIDKIRAEISDWQTDIHDNEHDAKTYDFVFERIYEILDEYKTESEE